MTAETALILAFVFGGSVPAPPALAPNTPAKVIATVLAQKKTRTVVVHGYSAGHTHVCPNLNCSFRKTYGEPFVWSHAMDAGHNCQYCKAEQKIQSRAPVTRLHTVDVIDRETPPERPQSSAPVLRELFRQSAASSLNCPPAG